jgi:hypothetical protein
MSDRQRLQMEQDAMLARMLEDEELLRVSPATPGCVHGA